MTAMGRRVVAIALAVVVGCAVAAPERAAVPAGAAISVSGSGHAAAALGVDAVAALPATPLSVSFLTEHGPRKAAFAGPLLWTVLAKVGAIDPAKRRDQVAQFIVVTGSDGYRAVLALAEIAPDFEGKPVILADRMDGKPLGAGHLRIVVPNDKHGGRSVRDVVRIEVRAAPPSP